MSTALVGFIPPVRKTLAIAIIVGAIAVACGSGASDQAVESSESTAAPGATTVETTPVEATEEAAPSAPEEDESGDPVLRLPEVTVLDVDTGDEVALASIAPSDKPILLWFWAPH